MPCYEVRLTSVEFSMSSLEYIERAVALSNLKMTKDVDLIYIFGSRVDIILNLNTKKAEMVDEEYTTSTFNRLKMKYSEVVISELAKKKKWLIKNKVDNKMTLRRY